MKWLLALTLLLAPLPAAAQSVTAVLVVYNPTTASIDETVIPTSDAESVAYLVPHQRASFPGDTVAIVSVNRINVEGFPAALAQACPACVTPESQQAVDALGSLVGKALAQNAAQQAFR